jgi:predicted RNase H-related nuclease YkuK (DUF458 family)
MEFKILSSGKSVGDVIPYIKDYIKQYEDTHFIEVIVGSDSQNRKRKTQFATVILLHKTDYDSGIGKGGHVLYKIEAVDKPYTPTEAERRDYRSKRLLNEAWRSIEVAEMLRTNGINVDVIDLDMNPDPKYRSNDVLAQATGWAEGMGYRVRCKPDAMSASYAADTLVK